MIKLLEIVWYTILMIVCTAAICIAVNPITTLAFLAAIGITI